MTSDHLQFRISLGKRLRSIEKGLPRKRRNKNSPKQVTEFSCSYLASFKSEANESFIVSLTKLAISISQIDGVASATAAIENFSKGEPAEQVKAIISPENSQKLMPRFPIADRYLLSAPESIGGDPSGVRRCYESALQILGVSLPFDKVSMSNLVKYIDRKPLGERGNTFEEIREFIWEVIARTWPLFDASILRIPATYLSIQPNFSQDSILRDVARMRRFGFERLLCRAILLHAVTGEKAAIESVLSGEIIEQSQCLDRTKQAVLTKLAGERTELTMDEVSTLGASNPIERAILLLCYLADYTNPFDFMKRVVEVYSVDPSILGLVRWDAYRNTIADTSTFQTPQLVGFAAILSENGNLDRSPFIRNLYVPSGASTDLLLYAKYCREQKGMTAHQFFASFAALPFRVQRTVFRYLLHPGTMDTLANVFPSEASIFEAMGRNDAVNALSLKLDCVAYLSKRRIIPHEELLDIEDQTRNRLRQIKYHADAAGGRIRVSRPRLIIELSTSLSRLLDQHAQSASLVLGSDDDIRGFIDERWRRHASQNVASFVCFRSRVAFDYLLSNLRHNFLRFRLESAVDSALGAEKEPVVSRCKSSIAEDLALYCENWLTISQSRSFFSGLAAELKERLPEKPASLRGKERDVATEMVEIALNRFSELLDSCRSEWTGKCRERIKGKVMNALRESELGQDTTLRDAMQSCLDRAFLDSASWLSLNEQVLDAEFGLRELFRFEATNFSTARTRRQPLVVECFRPGDRAGQRVRIAKDILIPGSLREAMISIIHNLLENAYRHCGLTVSSTSIEVRLIDHGPKITIEMANNFSREKIASMRTAVAVVNELASQNGEESSSIPLRSGGSGIRRIRFELDSVVPGRYSIRASDRELHKGRFLVSIEIPKA